MQDEKILRMLQSGNVRGLELLIDRYSNYLSVIVWNIVKATLSIEDAEEIVSDVFVTAWESSTKIQSGSLKAWCAAVARNKAKERLRRTCLELPLEEDILEIPDEFTPASNLEKKEESRLVRKALNELGEPDHEIFLRHYFYVQSIPEISRIMKMNESTIKTKLRRGRIRLKSILMRWDIV